MGSVRRAESKVARELCERESVCRCGREVREDGTTVKALYDRSNSFKEVAMDREEGRELKVLAERFRYCRVVVWAGNRESGIESSPD